jgi:hypothetical protein
LGQIIGVSVKINYYYYYFRYHGHLLLSHIIAKFAIHKRIVLQGNFYQLFFPILYK